MSLEGARTFIKTQIGSLSEIEIAKVHKYPRNVHTWTNIFDLFKDSSGKVNGWLIQWVRAPAEWKEQRAVRVFRQHTFHIWGMQSFVDDTSAPDFDEVVEKVLNKLSTPSLNSEVNYAQPASLLDNSHVIFADSFCHRAQIAVIAEEIVNL